MGAERTPLLRRPSGVLNKTPNVLVLYRLNDFQRRAGVNFWLALVSLICCGINIVLFVLNYLLNRHSGEDDDGSSSPGPKVSEQTFHLIEFWTTFVYALVDACALITSPRALIHKHIWTLKLLFCFNVVASLVPALLISMDLEFFEHIAHELEYINEFSLSLVSFILFTSLTNPASINANYQQQQQQDYSVSSNMTEKTYINTNMVGPILSVGLSIVVAIITFVVYNFGSEVYAHYFEFCFNIVSCLITFWFCMDNRFVAEMEIAQILFGQHTEENCIICGDANVILLEQRSNLQYNLQQRQLKPGGFFGSVWYNNWGAQQDQDSSSSIIEDSEILMDGVRSCGGGGCDVLNE